MNLEALHLLEFGIVDEIPDVLELVVDGVLLFIDCEAIFNKN